MAVDLSMPILIVDDYKTMLRIIGNLLKQLGFKTIDEATDGAEALSKMRSKSYSLVISDWNMAPMTGFQLLWQVQLPLALPYIFAGLRIATVAAIGIAAIAAVVGAGGLGRLIFDGIRRLDSNVVIAGAIMSILLALLADLLFSRLALLLRPDLRASAERG